MPRRLLLCGLFLAALAPWDVSPAPVAAQPGEKPDEKVTGREMSFRTADDVTLKGYLHRSANGTRSPVVILLHGTGETTANKGDFPELARNLSAKGFNVLRFDFRGYGESTQVATKFWDDPINKTFMPTLARKRPAPTKLDVANYKAARNGAYYPRLADDIQTARVALDQLNDEGEVNTSSVYLVGSQDAVTAGMLYIASEWSRPQKLPVGMTQYPMLLPRNQIPQFAPGEPCCGWDIAGAVWLSPARHPSVPLSLLQKWVQSAPEMRERTPMLFLYGDKDTKSRAEAKSFLNEVLAARVPGSAAPNLPLTQLRGIEQTDLSGLNLLNKDLGTAKLIEKYLEELEKDRKNMSRIPSRGYTTPPPGINLPAFGVCKI
jgi:hypothetical protein